MFGQRRGRTPQIRIFRPPPRPPQSRRSARSAVDEDEIVRYRCRRLERDSGSCAARCGVCSGRTGTGRPALKFQPVEAEWMWVSHALRAWDAACAPERETRAYEDGVRTLRLQTNGSSAEAIAL